MITIVEQILKNGKQMPDKTALCDGKKEITYAELAGMIAESKTILINEYHLKKGDFVILSADKQLEFVGLYFACHLIGAIVLPIAPDINEKRYEMIKDRVHPSLVVGFADRDVMVADLSEFAKKESAKTNQIVQYPDLDEVADIMFTTGTTGTPKGVKLTHRNIAAAAHNINTFIKNQSDDVEMIALPISHSFGIGRMRCALSNGQTVLMLGSFTNIKRFYNYIDKYHVTGFGMVPASWAFLKKFSGTKISDYKNQLRYIEIGSAPMPISDKQELIKILPNTRICMHYGLTEASRSAFIEFHKEQQHLDTIGKQTPNMHITIRDENGCELPCGQEGEICVEGDAVTTGYYNLPKEEAFWANSFRTGDWGLMDENGYITLKSRKKELINVGGKKVSPLEVEEVLMSFDFIKDCACIALPDPEGILGEVVKAYVVTDSPEKIVKGEMSALIGKRLEGYKHPAEYAIIDSIPKTSSGKVQRLLLQ